MEISKWLKGVTIGVGFMGALFFAWIMPVTADTYRKAVPELAYLYWPGMIYGWVIGAGCYWILFQFWNVCTEIGRDNSFSMENVKSFQIISRTAAVIGVIWFTGMLFLAWNRWVNPDSHICGYGVILVYYGDDSRGSSLASDPKGI